MGKMPAEVDQYIKAHRSDFEADLFELLKIPSVSADSKHDQDTATAANWVADQFTDLGFTTEKIDTAGHPIVLARSAYHEDSPTVLVYGHYATVKSRELVSRVCCWRLLAQISLGQY